MAVKYDFLVGLIRDKSSEWDQARRKLMTFPAQLVQYLANSMEMPRGIMSVGMMRNPTTFSESEYTFDKGVFGFALKFHFPVDSGFPFTTFFDFTATTVGGEIQVKFEGEVFDFVLSSHAIEPGLQDLIDQITEVLQFRVTKYASL
jgi:hypothetical protein